MAGFGVLSSIPIVSGLPGEPRPSSVPISAVPQVLDRIGFAKVIASGVDPDFFDVIGAGAGQTISQSGGNLLMTSGTTARQETIIRTKKSYIGATRARIHLTASQRIANCQLYFEMVDVIGDGLAYTINSATSITVTIPNNPFTAENVGQSMFLGNFVGTGTFLTGRYTIASVSGNNVTYTVSGFAVGTGTLSVFGWNHHQLLYEGTTATNATWRPQRRGYANAPVTVTINSTAAPGHIPVLITNDGVATLRDMTTASATGIQLTTRGSQSLNVPDDANLYLQIRVVNLATSPASNTTFTIGMCSIANFSPLDVVLQDVRPIAPSSGLPVELISSVGLSTSITGTPSVSLAAATNRAGFIASAGIWFDDSNTALGSGATFTGTSRDLTVTASAAAFANAATYAKQFIASAESDQSFTLFIEVSRDNTTWRRVKAVASQAVTGGGQYAEIVHQPSWRYIRCGVANGGVAQTRLTLNSMALAI